MASELGSLRCAGYNVVFEQQHRNHRASCRLLWLCESVIQTRISVYKEGTATEFVKYYEPEPGSSTLCDANYTRCICIWGFSVATFDQGVLRKSSNYISRRHGTRYTDQAIRRTASPSSSPYFLLRAGFSEKSQSTDQTAGVMRRQEAPKAPVTDMASPKCEQMACPRVYWTAKGVHLRSP